MNEYDATEVAYKNGYKKGVEEKQGEIDALINAVDNSTQEFLKLHDAYQKQKLEIEALRLENEKMYVANKEQQAEIDSFLESVDELQADKADVTYFKEQIIAKAKAEIAREIFADIEKFIPQFEVGYFCYKSLSDGIAELKKKYTEGEA